MQHLHFFEPAQKRKAPPLVLFLHSAMGHARMFYPDIQLLLERGFACASLEAPYSRSRNMLVPRGLVSARNERSLWDRTAEELVLALQECETRWHSERVGFFGLNIGGSVGMYWIAKGAPVQAAVVAGAVPDLTDFWLHSTHPAAVAAREEPGSDPAAYEHRMRETDLLETVPMAAAPVLVQFGSRDAWISPESKVKAERKFSGLARVRVSLLDDDHEMRALPTVKERVDFLEQALAG
jgi:dienelactone hydrolase